VAWRNNNAALSKPVGVAAAIGEGESEMAKRKWQSAKNNMAKSENISINGANNNGAIICISIRRRINISENGENVAAMAKSGSEM